VGDHLGPALQIGQPAQHPVRGEDDVEAAGEVGGQIVEVALHEGGGHPHAGREGPRGGHRLLGEVRAGDRRAVLGPADGVHPEVALEMKQ